MVLFEEDIGELKIEIGDDEEDMLFVRVNWNEELFFGNLEF